MIQIPSAYSPTLATFLSSNHPSNPNNPNNPSNPSSQSLLITELNDPNHPNNPQTDSIHDRGIGIPVSNNPNNPNNPSNPSNSSGMRRKHKGGGDNSASGDIKEQSSLMIKLLKPRVLLKIIDIFQMDQCK